MASAPTEKILTLLSGYQWPGTPITTTTVKYTFLTSIPSYYGNPGDETYPFVFAPFNSQQEVYTRQALELWAEVSKINFVEEFNPLLSDITFAYKSIPISLDGKVFAGVMKGTGVGLFSRTRMITA